MLPVQYYMLLCLISLSCILNQSFIVNSLILIFNTNKNGFLIGLILVHNISNNGIKER